MNSDSQYSMLEKNLIDATALVVTSQPVYALFEAFAGVPYDLSLKARLFATALTYVGVGKFVSFGRDKSKEVFQVSQKKEATKHIHDMLYLAAYTFCTSPISYIIVGSRDWKEILRGTLATTAVAFWVGGLEGYAIDVFRDLFGVKPSERLSRWVQKKTQCEKKRLATSTMLSVVIAMTLFYVGRWYSCQLAHKMKPVVNHYEQRRV